MTALFLLAGLAGCNDWRGGISGSHDDPLNPAATDSPIVIGGGGVKGPLANAIVTVYLCDSHQPDFKGDVVAFATTDDSAAITGLTIPLPISPPYLLEFTSDAGTTDITTNLAPVIATLRTVITQSSLDSGKPVYATPLTTVAVDIAIANSAPATTADEFQAALTTAATQVVSTVGFGMTSDIDIFDTPPVVDSRTDTVEEQSDVASYRSAVEALTAVVFEMEQQSSGDVDRVLEELSADLVDGAIDGVIGGNKSTVFSSTALDLLAQAPSRLVIPNTTRTVADVQAILVAETMITGSSTSTTELDSGGSISTTTEPAETNPDIDGDGTLNVEDAFPEDESEDTDTDRDGIGDNADADDDNNGILDVDEGRAVVTSSADRDGDGFNDTADNCPGHFNPAQTNTDGLDDGGDACDTDDDEDGTPDLTDAFPLDGREQSDADKDGNGDWADSDDDNDGIADTTEQGSGDSADHDNDGIPNSEDDDSDNDGVLDRVDFAPYNDAVTFNQAPATADSSVETPENRAVAIRLKVSDDGVAPGALIWQISGPDNGVLSGIAPNLTYTPNTDFRGNDSFSFTVTDGANKVSNRSVVLISLTANNDAPVIVQQGPLSVEMDEDGSPSGFLAPTITLANIDSSSLSWTGTHASHGTATVTGTGASPTITYVPDQHFNGTDSFEVTVSNGNLGSDTVTINVIIAGQDDLPIIGGTPATTVVDGELYSFKPTASDVDGDTLSFNIQNQPSWPSASFNAADGTFSGTPGPNDVGGDFSNIVISVTAGGKTVNLAPFSIIVAEAPAGAAVWDKFNWGDGSTWQ